MMTTALSWAVYFDPIAGASVEANNQVIQQLTGKHRPAVGGIMHDAHDSP